MKRFAMLLSLAITFALFGCDKDAGSGTLNIDFLATYQGEPLVMLEQYQYENNLSLLFQRFNFYISDISLVDQDGNTEEILGIDFISFDGVDNPNAAQEGYPVSIENVPAGTYTAINIGLGVPPDLNATTEADYEDAHPLGQASHYWSAWGSYIFSMLNAKIDTNGDGMHDDASILYHTGSDEVYRTVTLPVQIDLLEDGFSRVRLSIDVYDLLREGEGMIDLIANPATHDINNLKLANQIMDNFAEYLEVKQ